MEEKLNKYFRITKEELERRVNHSLRILEDYGLIVPLRNLVQSDYLIPMSISELEFLLKNIPLVSNSNLKPYENSQFKFFRIDPKSVKVAQTFISEEKLLKFHTEFEKLHNNFCFPHLSKMPAHYVCGLNSENEKVTGIYIPPIVEYIRDNTGVLIDGIHRGTIIHTAGTTIESIGIFNSIFPLPFEPIEWHKNIVKTKPPIEERFKNLDMRYYKDFGYVGLDG